MHQDADTSLATQERLHLEMHLAAARAGLDAWLDSRFAPREEHCCERVATPVESLWQEDDEWANPPQCLRLLAEYRRPLKVEAEEYRQQHMVKLLA